MRKHLFLERGAVLLCTLCLLLSGCSGAPAKNSDVSEQAAQLDSEAPEKNSDVSEQAAQLAAVHLGKGTMLTDAVEYSLGDFEGEACHVLLLKDTKDRFLAYSYETGNVYCPVPDAVRNFNGVLSTEEDRCIYLLWMLDQRSDNFYVNDQELRTALTEAELAQVNLALQQGYIPEEAQTESETPPPTEELPEGGGVYRVLTEYPNEFTRRELSDEEIRALTDADLETVRDRISTMGDFAAWLVAMGGNIYSNVNSNPDGQKTFGADFYYGIVREVLPSAAAASLAVRVLGDDLPGIGMVVACVAENDGTVLSGNLIPADGGYYLLSIDALTDEWKSIVEMDRIIPEAFPPIWVDGASGIIAWCRSADNPRGNTLTQAFYIPGDQQVVLDYKDGIYTPQSPLGIQEFFRDEGKVDELFEQKTAHIKPENIGSYEISQKLGGVTLTPEEAYALLTMEPEQVKKRVKTAADVLMLMLAGQYGDCNGDRVKTIDGQDWHYNLTAFEVMQTRTTNCGSAANLANYLLEGDYEEVGFILQAYDIGQGGGHVYNYFKYQGSYYIVDFSWYMFSNYRPEDDFRVMELKRLEDYGDRISDLYGGVCMALAHTSPGQHYPNVFDEQNKAYAIPAGTEYQLLYQNSDSNAFLLKEYPLDRAQLDWTTFGR